MNKEHWTNHVACLRAIREPERRHGADAHFTAVMLAAADYIERLQAALADLIEPHDEPCWRDHHGNCQAHFLGNPCEVAIAKQVIGWDEGAAPNREADNE